MKIYWATRLRGFLKHVNTSEKLEFYNGNSYEVNDLKQKILSRLIRIKLFDYLGFFQISKISEKECDYYASFNRFLKSDKPYFIYLENPTALYHYSINRIKYLPGKKRFNKCINDDNFKGFICMSKKCRDTFEIINGKLPKDKTLKTIYPLVPNNKKITKDGIRKKSLSNKLELLFCVQGVRFISKGGLEVLSAISTLNDVHLSIITKISDIDDDVLNKIKSTKNVSLYDFSFSYEELEKIYARTNILIQPTSDDSFGLTILEAMKGGCAIITTSLYSIPECVENNVNGILLEPKYYFFDKNGIPNPKVWNNRKKTIYSKKTSQRLINDIIDSIKKLNNDRKLLCSMSLNSYNKSIDDKLFGENGIRKQWEEFVLNLDK